MDCNICRCGYNNSLLCTKMGCLSWPKGTRRQLGERKKRKVFKKRKPRYIQSLKTLPKGPCVPGKFYKKDCRKCFCTDEEVGVCSRKKNACGPSKYARITKPDDVRPPVRDSEFIDLPALEHSAAKCKPGKAYKVDCNPCLCLSSMNMLCDKLLCISNEDTRRIAAARITGKPCNYTEPTENNCVKCTCNGTLQCEPIDNCVTESERKLQFFGKMNNGSRVALNYKKEKCHPNFVYRDDCNKCYCQKDRSLRCTQKTCLNFVQVSKLEKQRLYLQVHGL